MSYAAAVAVFVLVPAAWGVAFLLAGEAASAGARPTSEPREATKGPRRAGRRSPLDQHEISLTSPASASPRMAARRGGAPLKP